MLGTITAGTSLVVVTDHLLDRAAGLRAVQSSANNSKVIVLAGWRGLIALSPRVWTTGRRGREAAAAEGLEQRGCGQHKEKVAASLRLA